jgi:hypothetical protein
VAAIHRHVVARLHECQFCLCVQSSFVFKFMCAQVQNLCVFKFMCAKVQSSCVFKFNSKIKNHSNLLIIFLLASSFSKSHESTETLARSRSTVCSDKYICGCVRLNATIPPACTAPATLTGVAKVYSFFIIFL